jgi:ferric-dicitrate binding protein FerR (iron transport regulator)
MRKFFEGKLSREEAKSMMDWINSTEGEDQMGSMIEETWKEENPATKNRTRDRKNISKTAGFVDPTPINPKIHTRKPRLLKMWFGMAAAVVLLFAFGFALFSSKSTPEEAPVAQVAQVPLLTKTTARGQRKLVVLPDGSRVTLNADSRIEYSPDFKTNRVIQLEGEAFFDVVKDPAHPFSVISHHLTTTALGTSFNIKAYGEDAPIQVTLATGKVKVEDNMPLTPAIMMDPGEGVHFDPKTSSILKSKVDLKGALSWQEGILHFEKVPFDDILTELERWYGVQFEVPAKTTLPTYRCSGTFGPNEYLSNVLAALSYSVDFSYEINEKNVLLDFNSTKPMKNQKNLPH